MIRTPVRRAVHRIVQGRAAAVVAALVLGLAAFALVPGARAASYASGEVVYVAYQSPSGPNYIVDLGPQSLFVNAQSTLTFVNVTASDLNGVIGASAPNIYVGLFGVLNPSTRDGILSANGPTSDSALAGANILGAVNQTDSFGNGVVLLSSPVPSANPAAGEFTNGSASGSYQSTLDAGTAGSLGNNLDWSVETALSDGTGARIAAPVLIPFFKAVRNPFTGTSARAILGYFTLNPDGTITYSPRVFPYTSGDLLYVAYQSPSGPNYIVNLGPHDTYLDATTTLLIQDVTAADLDGVMGAGAANLNVALFGVLNPGTRDGIVSANGPQSDGLLAGANILGAVNQTDAFGNGVKSYSALVPSGNQKAGAFASASASGSYQSTLNAVTPGSLGNNLNWSVETTLSDGAGARNAAPVLIPFYEAVRNPFTGAFSHAVTGFFTLNPDGTIAYSPDGDGDLVPNDVDCAPADPNAWGLPGEVPSLTFTSAASFGWTTPVQIGGVGVLYDVFRFQTSGAGTGTAPTYACLQPDLAGPTSSDAATPPKGAAFFYLVAAGNSCGDGVAGTRSNGQPVVVPACP